MIAKLFSHLGLTTTVRGNALGDLTNKTISDLGTQASRTWTGVNHVGSGILDTSIFQSGEASNYLKNMPVTQNFKVGEFWDSMTNPWEKDGTNAVLADITGINIWNTVENADPRHLDKNIAKERITEMMIGIERQIINEIKDCLDGYLTEIVDKNPELRYLLDFENIIQKATSKIRNQIKLKVEREIEKLAYEKIKIQQVAQMRQKITNAIRKICPSHHSPPPVTRISPSLTKQLEVDKSWTIVDGINSLEENLKMADAEIAYYAQKENSTASKVLGLTKEAAAEITNLGISQVIDNNDKSVFDYVNSDGSIV